MKILSVCFCIAVLLVGPLEAFAVGDTFFISQSVIGTDTTAPTAPSNVQATPVSTSQITVSWDASVDNVLVAGYQLYRDGVQIATTTFTSYDDTGLFADTAYGYTLRAFDNANNFSSSSATTTATTDAVVVSPPSATSTPSHDGSIAALRMRDLRVEPDRYSARMSWATNVPTQSVVSWGVTHDYELASLEERSLLLDHATNLTGLSPGTEYFFRITARNRYGREVVLVESSFMTDPLPDFEAPFNVSRLIGLADGFDVSLSWRNPQNPDFSHVRVVRREDGFPVDPYDGFVVYEGAGEGYRDTDALRSLDRVQYAVFAYDESGNAASGALVRVEKPGVAPLPESVPEGDTVVEFTDLIFLQGGVEVSYIGTEIVVKGNQSLEISIPYEKLPEHLKTIMVTLVSPSDPTLSFAFLLRINAAKTAYSAVLAPLGTLGEYPMTVSILDYSQKAVTELRGTIVVEEHRISDATTATGISGILLAISRTDPLFWIVFFLLALITLFMITNRRSRWRV